MKLKLLPSSIFRLPSYPLFGKVKLLVPDCSFVMGSNYPTPDDWVHLSTGCIADLFVVHQFNFWAGEHFLVKVFAKVNYLNLANVFTERT